MNILEKVNLQKRVFLGCMALLSALLVSCSSTSDSSSDDLDETSSDSKASSSSQIAEGSVTQADVLDVNNYDNSEITSVTDTASGLNYSVITFGIYTWLGENVNKATTDVKNTCYAYDKSKCPTYGKLYMEKNAEENVCPPGFRLPSVYEWKLFLTENKIKVFGGLCTKRDTLECLGLDSSARYLARNDSAIIIDVDGSVKITEVAPKDFYSIRCVKSKSIVSDLIDLPVCDKKGDIGRLFVGAENQSYECYKGEWTETTSRYCLTEEKGTLVAIHDSLLYACVDGTWGLASINDINEKCNSKNFEKEVFLNGVRYACSDSGWIALKFPGSELGYCSESTYGKTAMAIQDSVYYHCDSTGWRNARLDEIMGTCDSTRYGKSRSVKDQKYVCRFDSWVPFSAIEKDFGACSADRAGEAHIYENSFYVCDTSKYAWRTDDALLHIGKCDSTRYFDTVVVGNVIYLCNDYNRWQQTSAINGKYYLCTSKVLGKIKNIGGEDFICKKDNVNDYVFSYATSLELKFGYCPQADTSHVVSGDSVYYCYNGNWKYYGKYVPKDTVVKDTIKKDTVCKYPIADIPECNYYTRDSIFFNGLTEYICNVYNENYNWILYSEDSVLTQKGYWEETVTIGTQTWYRVARDMRSWGLAVGDYDPEIYAPENPAPTCAEGFHLPSVADWQLLFDTMDEHVPGNNALKYFKTGVNVPYYFGKELRADHDYWTSDEIDANYAKCLHFDYMKTSYSFTKCVKNSSQFIACVRDEK